MHLASRNMHEEIAYLLWIKTLSKEIMKRARLRNKWLKNKNDYNKIEFSKQTN